MSTGPAVPLLRQIYRTYHALIHTRVDYPTNGAMLAVLLGAHEHSAHIYRVTAYFHSIFFRRTTFIVTLHARSLGSRIAEFSDQYPMGAARLQQIQSVNDIPN